MVGICLTLVAMTLAGPLPATAAQAAPDRRIACGAGFNGQELSIASARSKSEACATAAKVSDAYGQAVGVGSTVPFTAEADGTTWSCDEIPGGEAPMTRCVSSAEQVFLAS
ncbi:hypothetical protein ACU635_36215 [[Actinomadura] parvosata]|uniref:hypothetical protein n=1 Tax=[Actinomadura] parvosata TaxID=1955412 RepID=UPI00406C2DD9